MTPSMWLAIDRRWLKTGLEYDIARFSYDITTQIYHITSEVNLLIYNACSCWQGEKHESSALTSLSYPIRNTNAQLRFVSMVRENLCFVGNKQSIFSHWRYILRDSYLYSVALYHHKIILLSLCVYYYFEECHFGVFLWWWCL